MRKKNILIVAMIGTLMITSGGIMSFVTSFAKDVSNTKENIDVIQEKYTTFKTLMEEFNSEREKVYSDIMNELYVENAPSDYEKWTLEFQAYEGIVQKVTEYKPVLIDRCLGILYNDSNVQSECDSMVISYETAINYYVKDIFKFNSFIELYNAGVSENQLLPLDLKGYNYIDFNDDGKYLGK